MKKMSRRAILSLLIAFVLLAGTAFFGVDYVINGPKWASHRANGYAYNEGEITRGTVVDCNGTVLFDANSDWIAYNDDYNIRVAMLHALGDTSGNISSGIINNYSYKLIDYSPVFGLTKDSDGLIDLTLDSNICADAYGYLDGKKGAVGVYNYKTGEMLCMVSSSSYDPNNPPTAEDFENGLYDGVFVNRLLSGEYTPGSIMKVVTAFAAIENIDDIFTQTFICEQEMDIDGEKIICEGYHGEISFETALQCSCNCAFAQIANQLDAEIITNYVSKAGLLESININGVETAAGSFDLSSATEGEKAWACIGQYEDIINPCNFMVFMGAIANDGVAVYPTYVKGESVSQKRLMTSETAHILKNILKRNVTDYYGSWLFHGLEAGAKSGSAEVGTEYTNAMFTGFIDSEEYPYAFIVVSEDSGSGLGVGGNIASNLIADIVY